MARARLIKPGFFTNDRLGELPAVTRILFAGLWTIADREGRLEDRPTRIKAEVLPYDKGNVARMLDELVEAGFIVRYEANGGRFIQINAFTKHQHPHMREPVSTIPAPCLAPDEHSASTSLAPDEHDPGPAVTISLNPIPVTISGNPEHRADGPPSEPSSPDDVSFRERVETVLMRLPTKFRRDDLTIDEAEQLCRDFTDMPAIVQAQERIRRTPNRLPFPAAIRAELCPEEVQHDRSNGRSAHPRSGNGTDAQRAAEQALRAQLAERDAAREAARIAAEREAVPDQLAGATDGRARD